MDNKTDIGAGFAVVAVGSLGDGFDLYGPFTTPETVQDVETIRTALINIKCQIGEPVEFLFFIPGRFDQAGTETGQYVYLTGDIINGYCARGLFKTEDAARKSMSPFHHMSYLLTPLECSLSIKQAC
jgi:hypothetical protein